MKTNVLSTARWLVIAAATLLLPATSWALAPSSGPEGRWTAKVPGPNGQFTLDVVFTFKIDGSRLTGTASANGTEYNLVDASINGDRIAFGVDGEPARYSGKLAGNQLKMQVTFKSSENGARTWNFVAERAAGPQAEDERASIDGVWTGDVPRGAGRFIAARFELRADGSTLTGRVHALEDEFPITNGTIAGAHIAFNVGETKGDYSGELVGDTIRMKVKYNGGENGRVTLDFVLTRAGQGRS
jgi:hypothetical protein